MKLNKLKFSGIATAVTIVSLMSACGNKETKTETSTVKPVATVDANQDKIVFVDSDSLLNQYEYFKVLKTKMEAKGKAADADLKAKGLAFQRDAQQYQAQANSMTAEQRAATEQRLARKQQELQAYQQNAGSAFQNEQAKEQEALYNKVADFLKEYAKKKGYKMVLKYQKGMGDILFADESLDVTTEVIKGLNEAYAKEKK
ncbi:OmpH family outer membrane protein [Pedobacter sp. ASV28]|jgi:outer membrane protein|uniref:OmpH family outer membrane protein n=1 Tax=Pedobacter sp. ASV28 TaxID=2795123 RepID=UPI0018ECCB5D|nr:OmpH family outer membrane protein [Pedobacter sp. ASV28]